MHIIIIAIIRVVVIVLSNAMRIEKLLQYFVEKIVKVTIGNKLLLLFLSAYFRLGVVTADICIFMTWHLFYGRKPFPPPTLSSEGKLGHLSSTQRCGHPVKCLAQGHNKRTCRLVLHNLH